ncbi:MAG TPA: GH25 family lysozyme [Arenimonas sp.]|uniref:GH25 family lysozyme n=1 Tax=Arenimonas sp. TaxID=1872635 RepID=UPI002C5974F4|nr:GH25 family lysozyme [Arenimonas sp.]HMB57021.1 GH25 family lysozyme [Arenimonas sp.]
MKRALILLTLTGLIAALAYWSFQHGWLRFNYPSAAQFPIRGIDVSHHQGDINWRQVAGEGFAFAYIKATEGGDFRDERFDENWRNARASGLQVGAYHYYSLCRDGLSQADLFFSTVPVDAAALPPAIDLEFGGNCRPEGSLAEQAKEIDAFLEAVQMHYDRTPVLYVTHDFYQAFVTDPQLALDQRRLWVRDVYGKPSWQTSGAWELWQYGNRGHVAGIQGFVDLNAFNGQVRQWQAFVKRNRLQAPIATTPDTEPPLAPSASSATTQ